MDITSTSAENILGSVGEQGFCEVTTEKETRRSCDIDGVVQEPQTQGIEIIVELVHPISHRFSRQLDVLEMNSIKKINKTEKYDTILGQNAIIDSPKTRSL
ncbi:MAG: hypothetical protein QNK37_32690 [Acidobacteriota bacterium]|nr:hypothetical protein [Acidobacteriota bacterium]